MACCLEKSPSRARRASNWGADRARPLNRLSYSLLGLAGLGAAGPCAAASSEFVDSAAHVLALFIIVAVPIGGIVLFWLVHILPEKFAHERHHPQLAAIKTLCLLSLVFGGILWPLAWLWAFTKPVMHQMAYGRDKHDDYYEKHGQPVPKGDETQALRTELARVRQEIVELEKRGDLPTALAALRERLAELEEAIADAATTTPTTAGA
jgi:CBS domain containing-hemolysin-like protein